MFSIKIKNNIYITIGFFALIVIALVVFLLYPTWQDIKAGSQEIAWEKSKTLLVDKQETQLEDFEKNYEHYQSNLAKIDQVFVDAHDPINFITFLEDTASRSGASIDIRLSSLKEKSEATWPISLYQVSVRGPFSSIVMFATQLESGSYLTKVRKMNLKVHQQEDTKATNTNIIDGEFLVEVVTTPQ